MRLRKVKIANFKNLRNFQIDFDIDSFTTVLVGRNGTGKSNLLEALTIIFRDLDLGEPPSFKYELAYRCHEHEIQIDADPERSRDTVIVTIDGTSLSYRRFSQIENRQYLPSFVFGYYSGPSNRMEQHFERHQEVFYRDLLAGEDKPLRPLFYARLVHSQFVLLSFFTEQDPKVLHFLNEHLWIEGLDSILFVMRQPPWTSKKGDARFWNASGTVSRLLDKLYELSLAPMRVKQRIQLEFRKSSTLEHLYLYLKDADALQQVAHAYLSQQEFFKALESTYISKLISEVRIKVRVRKMDGSLTFRELSEGEQQLLMVLGLLRFTKEDESLFLLDEPDTHLNPAWSLQYLDFLREIVGEQITSHVVMTTHDPLTIAGLLRPQVQIIQRDKETGHIAVNYPEQDPRGMGIAALLTSDVYGLRSQLDIPTLKALERKRELLAKDKLTSKEESELKDLTEKLAGLDFSQTARDPLYSRFVEAMTKVSNEEQLAGPTLTKEQQEQQKEVALRVMKRLRKKKDSA